MERCTVCRIRLVGEQGFFGRLDFRYSQSILVATSYERWIW